MKVVISQPRYLPVISYLQRLYHADVFVFLDNVQIQRRGVENRNRILVNGKVKWLTIPVASSRLEKICSAKIHGLDWIEEHSRKLVEAYKKHPFFNNAYVNAYYKGVEDILKKTNFSYAETLIRLVLNACEMFGFKPNFVRASELNIPEARGVENLYNIAKAVGAKVYISGGNGRQYGVKEYFESRDIKVKFHDPEIEVYPQYGSQEFVPFLCFFDTLFNIGHDGTIAMINRNWVLKDE